MTTPITPPAATSPTPTSSSTPSASSTTDALGNEQVFLQLLVAQIQNQDPLNPTDSTTFMTQLAQFSDLEQLININQSVGQIDVAVGGTTTSQQSTTGTAASSGSDVGAALSTQQGTSSPSSSS
jgi:flagellar basal-body rod modification protein FlgD